MKVIVLGSGSAYGVPVTGGDWGDCDPNNPKNRRLSPSILIEDEGRRILVDMTPDFRQQAERHQIRLLDALLFTHSHADHITGMFHMPMLMQYYKDGRNLPLYADDSTRNNIQKNWWYMFDPAVKVEWYGPGRPYWEKVEPLKPFEVNGLKVTPFPQLHGGTSCMGYRIGNFAYSTDTSGFPPESEPLLEGLDVWLVESDRYLMNNPNSSHSHLEKTLGWIEKYKPKKAYLCHLNRTMDYDNISKLLPPNVELAYDNLEFTV